MSFDLFDALTEHAATKADQIALDDGSLRVRYGELINIVDALGRQFNELRSPQSGQHVVALAVPASTVAALYALAVLRSGNIWLQIGADDKPEHLQKILQQSRCKTVVALARSRDLFRRLTDATIVEVDADTMPSASDSPEPYTCKPESAADLYYTSGSTGTPKGVWKSHSSTISSARTRVQTGKLRTQDRIAIFGDWGYSYVRNTFYASLLAGARLIVPRGRYRNFEGVDRWLVDNAVTVTAMIPSAARTVASTAGLKPTMLRQIVIGGEPTTRQDIDALRQYLPQTCEIHNQFGAAEAGYIGFTDYTHVEGDAALKRFNLVDGHEIEIIDTDDNGIGVMKVTGPNVSSGYWENDALTSERFYPSVMDEGVMSFLSDDLVRHLGGNTFERAGRVDDRVKVRGLNIYLKEVESSLLSIAGLDEACVLVDSRRDKNTLIGFVTTSDDRLTGNSIRSALRDALPSQHIPRQVIVLPALPRTGRGKVDRQALASLSLVEQKTKNVPATDLEHALAEIWKNVLGLNEIDVLEEFTALGGDSLLAVELVSQVRKTFGVDDSGALLERGNSIRSMARVITRGGSDDGPLVVLREEGDGQPLFLVHGAGGELYNLTSLASLLHETRPIYAFRRTDTSFISIDRLAQCYVKELQKKHPEGPYIIAGYSFGGTVALQMGAVLAAQGETVSLIMLDVSLKPSLFFCRLLRRALLSRPAGDFVVSGSSHFHWLRRYKSAIWRFYNWQICGLAREVRYRMSREDMHGQIRSNRNQSLSSLSAIAHNVSDYPGKVAVFRAEQFHKSRPKDLGWSLMIPPSRLTIVDVPGSHNTILRHPDVKTLAKEVDRAINAFETKTRDDGESTHTLTA